MKKLCPRCKVEKELDQFYPDPRYKLGVQSFCRFCKNEGAKASQKKKRVLTIKEPQRLCYRSSRRPEHHQNRLEWKRLQRMLAKLSIESRDEELTRLIKEQAEDDRRFEIKHNYAFDTTHRSPVQGRVVWDEYFIAGRT